MGGTKKKRDANILGMEKERKKKKLDIMKRSVIMKEEGSKEGIEKGRNK